MRLTGFLGSPDDTVQAPALLLKKALELPANSVLFFVVPKNDMVEDAAVIQGLANLRNEFKANRRTIVLLGRDTQLAVVLGLINRSAAVQYRTKQMLNVSRQRTY